MSDLNTTIQIGNMVRDPDLRHTPSGSAVCSFSIASNYNYTKDGEKKQQTSFFNCTAWGKSAEIICQYLKKGQRVAVQGRLVQRQWEGEDGVKRSTVEINVETFQFLTPKPQGDERVAVVGEIVQNQPAFDSLPDIDIPF